MKLILRPSTLPQIKEKHKVPAVRQVHSVPAVIVKAPTALMVI